MNRHLLAIRHLQPSDIRQLLDTAARFKKEVTHREGVTPVPKRNIGLLFFENSTRTRVSFEQAAGFLGYRVVNFLGEASSMTKGETLKDTILTLRYELLDALVMRHHSSGACVLAAEYFEGPVINAGDGKHEHPTQALGDALTIQERKGRLDGLKVAIVGDVLHSRVARSNAWLLSKMGSEVRFVGPRALMPSQTGKLPGTVFYDLRAGIADCDVVICLRLQKERMDEGLIGSVSEYTRNYQVTRSIMRAAAPDVMLMHPGPLNRGIEVDDSAADGTASAITDQITNGVFVRMAALGWVFQEDSPKPKQTRTLKAKAR